jgi:hypothetical protein
VFGAIPAPGESGAPLVAVLSAPESTRGGTATFRDDPFSLFFAGMRTYP